MKNTTELNYKTVTREGNDIVYAVPVIRHVWKEKTQNDEIYSVREKIRGARNVAEVDALLEKSIMIFKKVSSGTIGKWNRAAELRRSELKSTKT